MSAHQFLSALYGQKDAGYILIWNLHNKKSAWFEDVRKASNYCQQHAERDTYVGVGLSPKDFGADQRCPADQIIGIPGLWIDIDYQNSGHKKANLPPSEEDAFKLLKEFPQMPTIILHSGGGLQCWWLFRELWMFDSDDERKEAANLAKRFNHTFKRMAQQHGWDVDVTHDLARIMRVANTTNNKREELQQVTIKEIDESRRYNPADLEQYLIDPSEIEDTDTVRVSELDIELNSNAIPPFDKFQLLMDSDDKFSKAWNRQRKDLQDQSPSAYDMSLATIAAMANWEPQEIADLIVAHRRKHGSDLKLRDDYYARTISKALRYREKIREEKEAEQTLEELETMDLDDADDDEKRKKLLKSLSKSLRVDIHRIIKYMSDPPQYRIETKQGSIMLGGVSNLISQYKLRQHIADAAGRVIPKMKAERWDIVAQRLLDVCEEIGMSDEATDEGVIRLWLEDYLSSRPPFPENERNEAVPLKHPFISAGAVHIFLSDFRHWLNVHHQERISAKQLGALLRVLGADIKTISHTKDNGKTTSRSVWRLPEFIDVD